MLELVTKIDDRTGELITGRRSKVSSFFYERGYMLWGEDLGDRGVKIELAGENEEGRAIILPPGKAKECGRWLLHTIGAAKRTLPNKLPKELLEVLQRLSDQRGYKHELRRGDKKTIKEAVAILKTSRRHN